MGRRPKPQNQAKSEMTPLELEMMQILWDRQNATAAEVAQALGPKRALAATTIHTVLGNMRKKGFIKPIPTVERALRFAPRVSRETVGGKTLHQLIRQFFGGSPQRLMAHLAREGEVGDKEFEEIRRLARESQIAKGKGQ